MMQTGSVKWYNEAKGYGFITPDEGGADVFVPAASLQQSNLTTLNEGARVKYDIHFDRARQKTTAINVQLE